MAKRTLGYVELNWDCPNCQTTNKGLDKSCKTCGAPQPENSAFRLQEDAKQITEGDELEQAKSGANISCPFCGTRNSGLNKICTQCGGDLIDGVIRQSGKVLNAAAMNICPVCQTKNDLSSTSCSTCGTKLNSPATTRKVTTNEIKPTTAQGSFRPWMALPIIAILLLLCSLIWLVFFKTTALPGTVTATHWARSIEVEAIGDVEKNDWKDSIPSDGKIISCKMEYKETTDSPTSNSKEVCTTEVVDQGNGAAKVEETCRYEVYADYCKYTIKDWAVINKVESSGDDLSPVWPDPALQNGQREGQRTENYDVTFSTTKGDKNYSTTDPNYYQSFTIGSEWLLSVNSIGSVLDISR